VTAVAISDDGRLLASGGTDTTIVIMDIASMRRIDRLLAHDASVTDLAFVEDDGALLSASRDGSVRRWNRPFENERPPVAHGAGLGSSVYFENDGVAVLGDGASLVTPEGALHRLQISAVIQRSVRRDGDLFVVTPAGLVEAWRAGAMLWRHSPDGTAIDVAMLDDEIAVATQQGEVVTLDPATGAMRRQLANLSRQLQSITAANGAIIVATFDGAVIRLDQDEGGRIFETGDGPIWRLAASPDGALIASAGETGIVRILRARDLSEVAALRGHQGASYSLAFTPDGQRLASGGRDGTIRLWALPEGVELLRLLGHLGEVTALSFSPDGLDLASAAGDETLRIWKGDPAR